MRIPHAFSGAENSQEWNIKVFQINQKKMRWILHNQSIIYFEITIILLLLSSLPKLAYLINHVRLFPTFLLYLLSFKNVGCHNPFLFSLCLFFLGNLFLGRHRMAIGIKEWSLLKVLARIWSLENNQVDTMKFWKYQKHVSVTEVNDAVSLFSQTSDPLLSFLRILQNSTFPLSKLYPFRQRAQL